MERRFFTFAHNRELLFKSHDYYRLEAIAIVLWQYAYTIVKKLQIQRQTVKIAFTDDSHIPYILLADNDGLMKVGIQQL